MLRPGQALSSDSASIHSPTWAENSLRQSGQHYLFEQVQTLPGKCGIEPTHQRFEAECAFAASNLNALLGRHDAILLVLSQFLGVAGFLEGSKFRTAQPTAVVSGLMQCVWSDFFPRSVRVAGEERKGYVTGARMP